MRIDNKLDKPANPRRSGAIRLGKFRSGRALGIAMVLVGALILTLVSGYYAYSASARSQLDDLNFVVEQPLQPQTPRVQPSQALPPQPQRPPQAVSSGAQPPATTASLRSDISPASSGVVSSGVPAAKPVSAISPSQPVQQTGTANQEASARPQSSYTALYPATLIHPKFWAQPLWSGGEPYVYSPNDTGTGLPDGFRLVSPVEDALPRGNGARTTRISIPLIDVDSGIKELVILNLGDSRAYETPKHLVGHIPQSPNPGEIGNAWYFGHLESPIRGEGNVFQRLPEIPDLLRDGDDVFVELESDDGRVFLYRTTRTEVMHQDELELYGADTAQLSLVACVPRLVYDHRIVVTAELVGIKDALTTVN